MKKLIYYLNILNYVICDLLFCIEKKICLVDLLLKRINPSLVPEVRRKDCLWTYNNHSISFLVLFTVPVTLLIAYFLRILTQLEVRYIIETALVI